MSDATKNLLKAAAIRALRTFAQAFIALIPTTAVVLQDVDWLTCLSGAALAAVLSILTSVITGLPEADAYSQQAEIDSLRASVDKLTDNGYKLPDGWDAGIKDKKD